MGDCKVNTETGHAYICSETVLCFKCLSLQQKDVVISFNILFQKKYIYTRDLKDVLRTSQNVNIVIINSLVKSDLKYTWSSYSTMIKSNHIQPAQK